MSSFIVCPYDAEYTFTKKIWAITVKACKHKNEKGTWTSKIIATQTYYPVEFWSDTELVKGENVLTKLTNQVKATSSMQMDFRPFAEIMDLFASFVNKHGGVAISHSCDNDLHAIAHTDAFFKTGVFVRGDFSMSPNIPKWEKIRFMCSQYLVSSPDSQWSGPYQERYPHRDTKLQTLVSDLGLKQKHTSDSDVDLLVIVLERLCQVSHGDYADDRSICCFAKPPRVGIHSNKVQAS
jgi:hypothetical protein